MGFIERLGYGVDRVIDLMRQQKLRAPEFEETAGGFRVLLRNHGIEAKTEEELVTENTVHFKGAYKGVEINPRQEAALVYLHTAGNTRITNSDLQELCPDVHAETIRRDLVDLVTKNILQKMDKNVAPTTSSNATDYDLITLGETMWRLSSPGHERLDTVRSLDLQVGGAESNLAIALARLKKRVAWWSRLPENALGQHVAQALRTYGVDVSGVYWQPNARLIHIFYRVWQQPTPD